MKAPTVKATGKACLCFSDNWTKKKKKAVWLNKVSLCPPVEGLSLLGAYEDSDEEDVGDSQRSTAASQLNQSADIDSTLANFMAVSIICCGL